MEDWRPERAKFSSYNRPRGNNFFIKDNSQSFFSFFKSNTNLERLSFLFKVWYCLHFPYHCKATLHAWGIIESEICYIHDTFHDLRRTHSRVVGRYWTDYTQKHSTLDRSSWRVVLPWHSNACNYVTTLIAVWGITSIFSLSRLLPQQSKRLKKQKQKKMVSPLLQN